MLRGEVRYVSPIERLMYLHTLPMFAELPPLEQAVLARYAAERRTRKGEVLVAEGRPVEAMYYLVDGEVELRRGGRTFGRSGARDAVGVFGLLAGAASELEAVVARDGLVLELDRRVLFDIFEDHFTILDSVLRGVARVVRAERVAIPGDAGFVSRTEPAPPAPHARPLDFAERMMLLRRSVPFGEASLMGLSQMARRATELRIPAGRELWAPGDVTEAGLLIRAGSVICRTPGGQEFRFGPGDGLGIMDVFARDPRWYQAITETDLSVIAFGAEILADVLEDHAAMARSCLALLAGQVLTLVERRAALGGEPPVGLDGAI